MKMQTAYMPFYFDGRDDELDTDDVDVEDLAEKALKGPDDVHTVILAAMTTLAAPLAHDREKREWLKDNQGVITEAGGDGEEAYRHYVKGLIDDAVARVEPEVLEAMDPREEDDDVTGGDGDEDEEDEEDDHEDEE